MKKNIKLLLFGFLTWLIPFVISFLFYSRDGKLLIDFSIFKIVMFFSASITASILLIKYFKTIKKDFLKESIIVGVLWLIINLILDILILIPISKMSLNDYFTQIGIIYIIIPVMSITTGYIVHSIKDTKEHEKNNN